MLRRVGPQRAADLGLRAQVEVTEAREPKQPLGIIWRSYRAPIMRRWPLSIRYNAIGGQAMAAAADRRIPLRFLHALAQHRLPDGELFRRYLAAGGEEACAAIGPRQAPLGLRACQHVLGETTAAEDAFQATFVLLARKGRSLTSAGSLAGWLHAAAVRLARDARRAAWRRRRRESAAG